MRAMYLSTLFAFLWAGGAWAVVTEPEDLKGHGAVDEVHTERVQAGENATYLSWGRMGPSGSDPVLTFSVKGRAQAYYHAVQMVDMIVMKQGYDVYEPEACLWGDQVLFCQTTTIDLNGTTWDVIVSEDFKIGQTSVIQYPNGTLRRNGGGDAIAIKSAYGNRVVVERDDHSIHLLTPVGGTFSDQRIAAGRKPEEFRPVIGPGGGDFPAPPIYVVYQEKDPRGGWTLKSWDVAKGRVVAEQQAPDEPSLSELYGFAYIEGHSPTTIRKWDPSEPLKDPDRPPRLPHELSDTLMNLSYHDCASLHEMRVGPYFALVRGENCAPLPGASRLFLVTRDRDQFVWSGWSPQIYQPFLIDEYHRLNPSLPFTYAIFEDYFAFYDEAQNQLRFFQINRDRIMPIESIVSPRGQWDVVPLAPWNVGSWATGEIDFLRGDRYHEWKVYLSRKQIYRIYAYSRDHAQCFGWPWDTRIKVFYPDGTWEQVDDNEPQDPDVPQNCAGVEIDPAAHLDALDLGGDFFIRIDRAVLGTPGTEPPMKYTIHVEVR